MPNRLSESNSPYLLQHAENPVDWYPWGQEALMRAQEENRPIFLSIGYAACHWCHVMAHESFEDPTTAAIMNEHFINIKVDREERPDIDNIYMNAVVALTGSGGWPMSVFLMPDGRPFYGGTYFPPSSRHHLPAFRDVLLGIARAWESERENVISTAEKVTGHLVNQPLDQPQDIPLDPELLDQAAMSLAQSYDWKHGGWGQAPKFPQPMAIEYLLRRATRGDKFALEIASHALVSIARGGMYDVIGGGFSRYSTDDEWIVPHFEKMLYDNAQLASVYLHAYLITRDDVYLRICEETLEFVMREMTHPSGGFFSSLDADSEGGEGIYYIWTHDELKHALGDDDDYQMLISTYSLDQPPNFEGHYILHQARDDRTLSKEFNSSPEEFRSGLKKVHARLLEVRERRARPYVDDKVLVSWNALMSVVLCEFYRYVGGEGYVEMATRNLHFILNNLYIEGRLYRSWREGKLSNLAMLEDHAVLILALLSLYQTDANPDWFKTAQQLAGEMMENYRDPAGGFFDTSEEQEKLIVRPKDIQDNAVPSGNALAATALLQLYAFTNRQEYWDTADVMLRSVQRYAVQYPLGFSQWLCAMDFYAHPAFEIAILGDPAHPQRKKLIGAMWSSYRPNLVAAISDLPISSSAPPLLNHRGLVNGLPTAYVCQSFTCKQPVNDPAEFLSELEVN